MLERNRGIHAPVNLVFDDPGLRNALAYLLAIRDNAPRECVKQLNALAFDWQREIKRHIPVDEGHARRSITVVPAQHGMLIIMAQVGTNTPYVPYLEFGAAAGTRRGGRGLFAALRQWKMGDDPIRHWWAKDKSILELMDRRDRARKESTKDRYRQRLAKAESPNHEEFAPPFRGSWPLVVDKGIKRMRKSLADILRKKAMR